MKAMWSLQQRRLRDREALPMICSRREAAAPKARVIAGRTPFLANSWDSDDFSYFRNILMGSEFLFKMEKENDSKNNYEIFFFFLFYFSFFWEIWDLIFIPKLWQKIIILLINVWKFDLTINYAWLLVNFSIQIVFFKYNLQIVSCVPIIWWVCLNLFALTSSGEFLVIYTSILFLFTFYSP